MHAIHIDPLIKADSTFVLNLNLCQVRLCNNSAFPWVMLIPNTSVTEIVDLSPADQQTLMQEICLASTVMRQLYAPKKLNIASIGNAVPQIHVHVVARYEDDGAWPRPVWYCGVSAAYTPEAMTEQITAIKTAMSDYL